MYLAIATVVLLYWFLLQSKEAGYHITPWRGFRSSRHGDDAYRSNGNDKERESKMKLLFRQEYEQLGQ